jgi:hypothetical protein
MRFPGCYLQSAYQTIQYFFNLRNKKIEQVELYVVFKWLDARCNSSCMLTSFELRVGHGVSRHGDISR